MLRKVSGERGDDKALDKVDREEIQSHSPQRPDSVTSDFVGGPKISALFVERGGVYWNLPGVDPWDKERDARLYSGPYPVVAHPPCERWGSFWYGGPTLHNQGKRKKKGDDGGCFESALAAVNRCGGVLEHPRNSHAWAHFGLINPPDAGGWIRATMDGGWTCCVYQGYYGHKALKPTWLYFHGQSLPPILKWGRPDGEFLEVSGRHFDSVEDRKLAQAAGFKYRSLPRNLRSATPEPFRDLLIQMAVSCIAGHTPKASTGGE